MISPIEFLETRRTIPAAFLQPPGPNPAELARLLTVAARVPDHGKLAPWRFILFEGDARAAAGAALAALRRRRSPPPAGEGLAADVVRFSRVPLVVGLVSRARKHPKATEWEQVLSAGAAGMNLLNAAHALGFGAQWLTEWLAYDEEAGAILGLKPGERFAGFIHIGTPATPPQERWRPALADIVRRWPGG